MDFGWVRGVRAWVDWRRCRLGISRGDPCASVVCRHHGPKLLFRNEWGGGRDEWGRGWGRLIEGVRGGGARDIWGGWPREVFFSGKNHGVGAGSVGRAVRMIRERDPASFREVACRPRVWIRLIFLLSSARVGRPISVKLRVSQ